MRTRVERRRRRSGRKRAGGHKESGARRSEYLRRDCGLVRSVGLGKNAGDPRARSYESLADDFRLPVARDLHIEAAGGEGVGRRRRVLAALAAKIDQEDTLPPPAFW